MKKYEYLYGKIKKEIESGIIREGERLLSIREEAFSSSLSVNTVISAYNMLADEGIIRPRDRGGYYVCSGALKLTGEEIGEPVSPNESFISTSRETGEHLDQLYERLLHIDSSFASAAPGLDILPSLQLNPGLSLNSRTWSNYGNPEGDYKLRKRIALINQEIDGSTAPDNIVITNGATEAMTIVIQTLLCPGDKVALESPTYFNYFRQLSDSGIDIIEIPVNKNGIDLNILEEELKKNKIKMIITQPNVQNPTGIVMSDIDKERLVKLAESYNSFLVQDDVFGDLSFAMVRPVNLSLFSDYPGIILVSSYSKSIAPGLRIGWIRSPRYAGKFTETKLRLSMDTSGIAQAVLSGFLGTREHRRSRIKMRNTLKSRIDDHLSLLSEFLPEGSHINRPQGGCLLWISLPKDIDGVKLFEAAAGNGLIMAPGAIFSSSSFFNNYIRINTGFKLTSKRIEALSILKNCRKLL